MKRLAITLTLATLGAAGCLRAQGHFRVYVLAGQSNMVGQVQNLLLDRQAAHADTAGWFTHLRAGDSWRVRDDVFVTFEDRSGPLSVGFGSRGRTGIELEFGTVLGEHFDEPVLLVKTAWGGHALDVEFRPPSAGDPDDAAVDQRLAEAVSRARRRNEQRQTAEPLPEREQVLADYGKSYRAMIAAVRQAIGQAGERFAPLAGLEPKLAGFVWHQGWNDQYEGRETRYADNLRCLIRDVRKDLDAATMPVVVAVMGQNGSKPAKGAMRTLQLAQLQVGTDPTLAPIRAVSTDELVDRAAEDLYPSWREQKNLWDRTGSDHPYHYLGSAVWHLRIGRETARAMLQLDSATRSTGWPQGPGPTGDWSAEGPAPPLRFSARTGENILWRTPLPETGQGTIAVHGDVLFVATMAPWDEARPLSAEDRKKFAHAIENREVVGRDIDAHCLDAATGEILWTRRIPGTVPSIYSYPFSDATSASPVTDGEHAWFTNGGGTLVCYTREGDELWRREFVPTYDGPFNKQFEPVIVIDGDTKVLVHMEPLDHATEEGHGGSRWNHLLGIDALTGKVLWRSEDALTHYNAPTVVHSSEGPCMLHARGGPHNVPERPVGLSLTRLVGPDAGKALWRYEDARGNHEGSLQTMAADSRHVYWLLKEPRNLLVVLDRHTGEELGEISLTKGVERHWRAPADQVWRHEPSCDLDKGVFPARYSMIASGGRLYFQCYATAWQKDSIGPPWSFACVDPGTGGSPPRVTYVEVATDVEIDESGQRTPQWRTKGRATAINSRDQEVTGDDRSRWDGWDWVFNGSPSHIGDRLYFTLASGVVYVIDADGPRFDPNCVLAVCDLGLRGRTWTANSVSYQDGCLFHRTAREVLCIGRRLGPP